MATTPAPAGSYRPLIILLGIVLITGSLYLAQRVLIPLALALLLAFILSPVVDILRRRGLSRTPSVILVVVLSLLLVGGLGAALALQVKGLADDLPHYKDNISKKLASLRSSGEGSYLEEFQNLLKEFTEVQPAQPRAKGAGPQEVRLIHEPLTGAEALEKVAGPAAELLANAALILVLVIFLLIRREDMRDRLVRLVAHGRLVATTRAFEEGARRLSSFLVTQVCINAGLGIVLGVGLFLIGVPYPLLWGLLAATLRFLPYVGIAITTAVLALFCAAVFPGWTETLMAVGLIVALELAVANAAEPVLLGHSTGVSPVALLAAAAFWTWLWGPLGLVLSAPLTTCLVVLGRYVPHLEFLGVLLGDEPALEPAARYYQRLLAHDQDEAADLVEDNLKSQDREAVFDQVLAPALVLAKRDRVDGSLTDEDEQFIVQATRDILDDLATARQQGQPPVEAGAADRPRGLVIGCPARDREDELALHMLRVLLGGQGCDVEVMPATALASEVVKRVEKEGLAVVCIAALPPEGLAQTRYLCKRLRAQCPRLKVVVCRWGQVENLERLRERLLASGADEVVTSLLEARDHLIPLVQFQTHVQDGRTSV